MKHKIMSYLLRFLLRGAAGLALIFFINGYVLPDGSSVAVGMNPISFLASGTLGVPGVCLLYGIMYYQIL